jgi:hypothetical protein
MCACGTYSIGRCSECHKDVCGNHSKLFEGRRLCDEHYQGATTCQEALLAEEQAQTERRIKTRFNEAQQCVASFLTAAADAGNPGAIELYRWGSTVGAPVQRHGRGWEVFEYERNRYERGDVVGQYPQPVFLTTEGEWCTVRRPERTGERRKLSRNPDYLHIVRETDVLRQGWLTLEFSLPDAYETYLLKSPEFGDVVFSRLPDIRSVNLRHAGR